MFLYVCKQTFCLLKMGMVVNKHLLPEHGSKIKNVFFVERERLRDSAITDQTFDFHAVNN